MIKSIWNFLVNNGNIIMMIGRLIIVVCVVMLLVNMLNPDSPRNIPWAVIISGIAFYVVGFIAKMAKNRRKFEKEDSEEL
jgi:uncharacterized protein YhhL (DUF1145 family)